MTEALCERCQKPPAAGCEGRGEIRVDDWTVQHCPHFYAKQLRQHLGDEISLVKHVPTPLLEAAPEGGPPLVDLSTKNIYVRCGWNGFLPHLKSILVFKGPTFPFRIVTDEKIKNVFVGNENYRNISRDDRDQVEVNNSLSDLVGENVDLAIIRLGFLGYKNISAAGALKEALMHRATLRKATWLIEDTDPNLEWRYSKNDEVAYYVERHFEEVHLNPADPGPSQMRVKRSLGMTTDEELPDLQLGRSQSASVSEGGLDLPGPKKFQRKPDVHREPDVGEMSLELPGSGNKKGWRR